MSTDARTKPGLGSGDFAQILGKAIGPEGATYLVKWKAGLDLPDSWEPGGHFPRPGDFARALLDFEARCGSSAWSKAGEANGPPGAGLVQLDCDSPSPLRKRKPPAEKRGLQEFLFGARPGPAKGRAEKKARPIEHYLNYQQKLRNQQRRLHEFASRKRPPPTPSEMNRRFRGSRRCSHMREFIKTRSSRGRRGCKAEAELPRDPRRLLPQGLVKAEETDEEAVLYKDCLDMIDGISNAKRQLMCKSAIRLKRPKIEFGSRKPSAQRRGPGWGSGSGSGPGLN